MKKIPLVQASLLILLTCALSACSTVQNDNVASSASPNTAPSKVTTTIVTPAPTNKITTATVSETTTATVLPASKIPSAAKNLPASHIQSWNIQGAIGVQQAKDAWSATISWQQTGQQYKVNLVGPVGVSTVNISGKPGFHKLVNSKNQTFTAKTSEQIFKQQTGIYLPVSYLYYWIRGLAVPSLPANPSYDSTHRIASMRQAGWTIEYPRYTTVNGIALPSKMVVSNAQMKIKLVVNSWTVR